MRRFFPGFVLAIALALSTVTVWAVRNNVQARNGLRFDNAVQATEDRIVARLETYMALLRSGSAFFAASEDVSKAEFRDYVDRLLLQKQYPGIQGFGYTARVPEGGEAAFVARQRAQGRPEFRLWPDSLGERHAIVYLEPEDARNLEAVGYNMYSEAVRREAMARARDFGAPALTGKVELVQEIDADKQAGFLIYAPLYTAGPLPDDVADRRARLRGFVYAPFRADDLLGSLFTPREQPRAAFRIYDGPRPDSAALLHDSRRAGIAPVETPAYPTVKHLDVAGRTWTVVFAETPFFVRGSVAGMEWYVGLLCLGLSVLLFGFMKGQQRTARDAVHAEHRLRAVLEGMPAGVLVANHEARIVFANTTARRLWEVSPEADVGAPATWREHLLEADDDPLGIRRALRGEATEGALLHLAASDGPRTLLCAAFPLNAARAGEAQVVVTAIDISDRVHAEEALREREREFTTLANSIPQLAWMTDETGFVFWYNDRWYEYTGTTLDEVRGWGWQIVQHPDHLDSVAERFVWALETGEPWEDTFPLRGADGTYRWFLSRARPIRDEDGRIVRWFGTNTDVTEQRAAQEMEARAIREQAAREAAEAREDELRRIAAELQRSNRELQDFAYIASHDLQEPLRRISAFSDLVRLDYAEKLDEQGRYYLDRIQHGALRMSHLIRDLLAFSRVSTRRSPFTSVDLDQVVEEVRTDLEIRLRETRGTLVVGSLPTVQADPLQMRQLFQNLIANAVKFHRDGVPPEVHVAARPAASEQGVEGWEIEVRDNGIGFDGQYAERIFTPFQRLHPQGTYEGTGIGLAICRRIAENHQGTIEARSVEGEGTTFRIWIPREPSAEPPALLTGSILESLAG